VRNSLNWLGRLALASVALLEQAYRLRLLLLVTVALWLASKNSQVIDAIAGLDGVRYVALVFSSAALPAIILFVGGRLCGKLPVSNLPLGIFTLVVPFSAASIAEWSIFRLLAARGEVFSWYWIVSHCVLLLTWCGILWVFMDRLRLIGKRPSCAYGTFLSSVQMLWPVVLAALFLLGALVTALLFATILGTGLTLMCMLLVWTALFSCLTWISLRFRVHIVSFLLIVAGLSAIPGCNNNHELRKLKWGEQRRIMAADFVEWMSSRPDKNLYPDGYPVIVVAAEGGGIRAAFTTAMALAELEDAEPRFAEHLYLISSVSGGSVGAAVFASLCKTLGYGMIGTGGLTYTSCVDRYFSHDFLAPVVSSLLGPELLQKLIPFRLPFFPDRAEVLEKAFESGWVDFSFPQNPLSQSIDDLYRSHYTIPRIFFNTTNVETGQAGDISPFADSLIMSYLPDRTFRESTAMIIGARFPYVTPAGFLDLKLANSSHVRRSFVDGGYNDNTGCTALARFVSAMEGYSGRSEFPRDLPPIHFVPVLIRHVPNVDPKGFFLDIWEDFANPFADDSVPFAGSNEFLIPLQTILAKMQAESLDMRNKIVHYVSSSDGGSRQVFIDKAIEVFTTDRYGKLPLGWSLSPSSRRRIRKHLLVSHIKREDEGARKWQDQFEPTQFSVAEEYFYRAGDEPTPEEIQWGKRSLSEHALSEALNSISGRLLLDDEGRPIERYSISGSMIYDAWNRLCRIRNLRKCSSALLAKEAIVGAYQALRDSLSQILEFQFPVPLLDRRAQYVKARITALDAEMRACEALLR
jgi:hypothetical protein